MEKITYFSLNKDNTEVLDGDLIKIAALKLPEGIEYDPDYLYLKVRAVSAGEYWGCNKNYDYFPEEDLKKYYKTFLNAHVFKNHENKQIENAIGDVLRSDWDDSMKCVVLLIRIDKRLAPTIIRGFEKGFMTDVSMGCRVDYSVCSICGNKAKTRFQFCNHIKDERGKIYNDGRKVYEINVAPKFHDISAVLTGAERSAKAVEIYHIEKTASLKNESMDKTAGFMDSLIESGKILESQQKNITEKIASEQLNDAMAKKHEDKKDFKDKVSSIKKEIQGEVIKTAKDNIAKKGLESLESLSKIVRMLFTDYWDKNKCRGIAEQIKHISDDKNMDVEDVFDQFLKVLDFANINLTPTELHDIRINCMDKEDNVDLRKVELPIKSDAEEVSSVIDSILNKNSIIPTAKTTMIIVNKSPFSGPSLLERVNSFKRVDEGYDDSIMPIIMRKIVSPLIPGRSDHPRHLVVRLSKIANEEIEPNFNFTRYYSPLFLMDKEASEFNEISKSAMIYSAYQNDRVDRYNNGDLNLGMTKFASIVDENNPILGLGSEISLEKTAKITPTKASLSAIPATFTYSALQRSRINNGEDVNSFNRYVAENPTNASLIAATGTKAGAKSLKKSIPKIKDLSKKGKKVAEKVVDYFKISEEEEKDMFKNSKIDNIMFKKGYSVDELDSIKKACILYCLDDYVDDADQILQKMALDESNVNDYLKQSSNFYKIEIEKCASANLLKNVRDSIVGGMLFRNAKNSPAAAQVPGMIFDGLALTAVSNGIKKATKKLNSPTDVANTPRYDTQIEN